MADVALRLGPDNNVSSEKQFCTGTQLVREKRQINTTPWTTRPTNPPARFAFRRKISKAKSIKRPSSASNRGHRPRSAATGIRSATKFQVHCADCMKITNPQRFTCRIMSEDVKAGTSKSVAIAQSVSPISKCILLDIKTGEASKVRRAGARQNCSKIPGRHRPCKICSACWRRHGGSFFFSSGLAAIALRHGPERDISGERKGT